MAFLCLLSCFALLGTTFGSWLLHPMSRKDSAVEALQIPIVDFFVIMRPDEVEDECGDTSLSGRSPASDLEQKFAPMIHNAEDAPPNSWPWHVTVQTPNGRPRCGGSLIYRNWVVTAALCKVTPSDTVVAGLYDQSSPENDIQILRIAKIFRPPWFDPRFPYEDIVLLKLSTHADFNGNVSSVALPFVTEKFTEQIPCKVVGWGLSHPNGTTLPDKLQQATVELLNKDECPSCWGRIQLTLITLELKDVSMYKSDSGGSLVCLRNGVWTLMGVMACFREYCPTNMAMMAIRFPNYMPWVEYIAAHN